MKALLRTSLVVTLSLATVLLSGDRVSGFSYFSYGGYSVIWYGSQSVRYLAPGTFPEGSETDNLILAAMGLWNIVPSSEFEYFYARLAENPVIDNYDGRSDTAAVPSDWLDPGVLGVTYMVNLESYWYDMDLLFSDFPENVGWHMLTDPDCQVTANPLPENGFSFYIVAAHELGHALGLGHDPIGDEEPGSPWFVQMMNPAYPAGGPVGENNIVELHTSDRNGIQFLYPGTPETLVDLAMAGYCAQGPRLGQAVPSFFEPASIASGQELTVWSVIENFGTTSETNVRQGFYLSTDDQVGTDDLLLGDALWDLPVSDGFEFSATIPLPDLLPGVYYLGSMLDDLNEIAEDYEDNNNLVYCDPLVIEQGQPTFAAFSQQIITCDQAYFGPTPQVAFPINAAPITWSLDNPQPGMNIDPDTGVIFWPSPIKAPFLYELDVRATNGAGTVVQTLELGVHQAAPHLVTILNQTIHCGTDYVGPRPTLTAPDCMSPILDWSLVDGPPGMTINPASGVVSWPGALVAPSPYAVTLRAINDVGETTESWLLSVVPADGDLDVDSDVDLTDHSAFDDCLDGPGHSPGAECLCADFDGDDDVDLADFAVLANAFTGVIIHEGACCLDDGLCSEGSPEDCDLLGGTYRGDGTNCQTETCLAACCYSTGGCLDDPLGFCDLAGGRFQGFDFGCADITCPTAGHGACCHPDESCTLETPAGCSTIGGSFHGLGMACEAVDCSTPAGACCYPDGTCAHGSPADCTAAGGTYLGNGTICTATSCHGACCYATGACIDRTEPQCAISGGVFQGAGTDCATTTCPVEPQGACCHADETCTFGTAGECSAAVGLYMGDDVTCGEVDCTAPEAGACCHPDESCTEGLETDCVDGIYFGHGSRCSEVDCSLNSNGACCSPIDWSCSQRSETDCLAEGGTYEGDGTTCEITDCPEYRNDAVPETFWTPGANVAIADDLTLGGTDRDMVYYELAVAGVGGGTFDVTAELYTNCPGLGGWPIVGTQATWTDVPADSYSYILSVDLPETPVTLPDTVWMVVSCSSANAGWVLSGEAETGFTDDLYAENDPPWVCDYWFGGPPDYAGFWAAIQCIDGPEGQGACCHADQSCTEGTQSACDAAGGIFQGNGTTCATVDCANLDIGACCNLLDWSCALVSEAECVALGGSFDGNGTSCATGACPEYSNEIDPVESSFNPGKPMADDIVLAGTARDLSYFEIAVYGGGGGPFDLSTVLYDASPCDGGVEIPGTLVTGAGLPDGQVLDLNVTLPAPVTLPDEVWLIVEFSNPYAGWILADAAEVGTTSPYFAQATFNEGTQQWEWACDYWFGEPPANPHGGFWLDLQCIEAGGIKSAPRQTPVLTVTPLDWDVSSLNAVNGQSLVGPERLVAPVPIEPSTPGKATWRSALESPTEIRPSNATRQPR